MISPVADTTLFGAQGEQSGSQAVSLRVGPTSLRLIEYRHVREFVETQQSRAVGAAQIERDRDHDAAEPAGESGRIRQVFEPPVGSQIGFLNRVLGALRVAQNTHSDSHGHRLGGLNEPAICRHVTGSSSRDEVNEAIGFAALSHRSLKDTSFPKT